MTGVLCVGDFVIVNSENKYQIARVVKIWPIAGDTIRYGVDFGGRWVSTIRNEDVIARIGTWGE